MYYLYHIPGKKIGVTRDLNERVTIAQGYKKNDSEVLDKSEDKIYILKKKSELQNSDGNKRDRKLHKN